MPMKVLQLMLVAVAGAAAAIPGLAVTRQFDLPAASAPLFEFVLVTVSAALVLAVYVWRHEISETTKGKTALVAGLGIVGILAFFAIHIGLTSIVLVEHSYEGDEVERQFFPLFVSERGREAIYHAGSRRAFIENAPKPGQALSGPEGVLQLTNEWNSAVTLIILLLSYAALVGASAVVFGFLGFHAVGGDEPRKGASVPSLSPRSSETTS